MFPCKNAPVLRHGPLLLRASKGKCLKVCSGWGIQKQVRHGLAGWICPDWETDESGVLSCDNWGHLFQRLRFWIRSWKSLLLFFILSLTNQSLRNFLFILLLPTCPPPQPQATHAQFERKQERRTLVKCHDFRGWSFWKSHALQSVSEENCTNILGNNPESLTFNNLINFFKCLLDVSLFKFFFRAQEWVVFYGILSDRKKKKANSFCRFLPLANFSYSKAGKLRQSPSARTRERSQASKGVCPWVADSPQSRDAIENAFSVAEKTSKG